jgi:CRISPR-associated endonuclease/helicase Cas3
VFVPPSQAPPGHLRQAAEISRRILAKKTTDPLTLTNFEQFFKELYWLKGDKLDSHDILKLLAKDDELRFSFRTAADRFHIIDDSQQASVLVRYSFGAELIEVLMKTGPERWLLRKLQRYVVNLPKYVHSRLLAENSIREVYPEIFIQENNNLYDPMLGLCPDKSLIYEPDDLII